MSGQPGSEDFKKLRMLWVDLSISPNGMEIPAGFDSLFELVRSRGTDSITEELRTIQPDFVCLDYDYPDRAGLQFGIRIKTAFPSMPIIMSTIQHSEELAVWAFRSRLTDYLVKPVARRDLERCRDRLAEMCQAKRSQRGRGIQGAQPNLPSDAVSVPRLGDRSFLPAVFHVSQNYASKITNAEVAELCAMSPFRFSRGFKQAFGINFRDYLIKYRLRIAFKMLQSSGASVSDVAFAVGFNDASYFTRTFRRYFNICPSELSDVDDASAAPETSPTMALRIPEELIRKG